jgi:hypothetical protein
VHRRRVEHRTPPVERAVDIEAGRIKSIIEPRLADHVRREALKFLNELKRAV